MQKDHAAPTGTDICAVCPHPRAHHRAWMTSDCANPLCPCQEFTASREVAASTSGPIKHIEAAGVSTGEPWPKDHHPLTLADLTSFCLAAALEGCPPNTPIRGKTGPQWFVSADWPAE
jgi:hypothetical protein